MESIKPSDLSAIVLQSNNNTRHNGDITGQNGHTQPHQVPFESCYTFGTSISSTMLLSSTPQELRNMVYELLLKVKGRIGLTSQIVYKKRYLLQGNGLIITCKQISNECSRVLCSHEILIASTCKHFEFAGDLTLTIPTAILENVRFLTVHLSAPELKMSANMQALANALSRASKCRLENLNIEIFPFRACSEAKNVLSGMAGRYAIRKGLGILRHVKVRGSVTIRLVGGHQLARRGDPAKYIENAYGVILKDIADGMVANDVVRTCSKVELQDVC